MWTTERHGSVVVATYDHPPMGYLVGAAVAQLPGLIDEWADPSVRAVVLTGTQDRFITHSSVEEILALQQAPLEQRAAAGPERVIALHHLFDRLTHLGKPVIAALTGDTMGGGLILAMACDIRIATRGGDHRLGLPEVRLGIIPSASGVQRLVRLIGLAAALDLALSARVLTPEEALEAGLVHRLADDPRAAALALAQQLAALPATALAMTKHAAHRGADLPLDAAVALEADASVRAKLTDDAARAMAEYVALPHDERRAWLDADRP
jgi:enoyl-CoA hydratase